MTLAEAQAWGSLELGGVPELQATAARDAALLLRSAAEVSRAQLLGWPERSLTPVQEESYRRAIARRKACEPVQYITGEQEFYGLSLGVAPGVLIPRPETEVLVESVLAALRPSSSTGNALRILDVGTGSGAIALALASELPVAELTAVDISAAALAIARGNAAKLGLTSRMRFVTSDLLDALSATELFDVVVSNPPYVPSGDRAAMHPQVREYEPPGALFAGESGLNVYQRLIPAARSRLRPRGLFAAEIGFGQRDFLEGLLADWDEVTFVDDLQGIARVVMARRPPD
ncbi:MAG: peptide chain release factor N(5)-glutamine methyltransferase [Acidobacteriaceae bacterium]